MIMILPWILIFGVTAFFFVWERVFPGRELPESPTWYFRTALLNSCQIAMVILSDVLWSRWLPARSLFHFPHPHLPVLEGLTGWFLGTFFFYYHSNIRTPRWVGFFLRRPEHIPFIINWICTNSTTGTLHYGIDSSEHS